MHPSKIVSLGDELEVMVLDIDEERRRISLGIKQCKITCGGVLASQMLKVKKSRANQIYH